MNEAYGFSVYVFLCIIYVCMYGELFCVIAFKYTLLSQQVYICVCLFVRMYTCTCVYPYMYKCAQIDILTRKYAAHRKNRHAGICQARAIWCMHTHTQTCIHTEHRNNRHTGIYRARAIRRCVFPHQSDTTKEKRKSTYVNTLKVHVRRYIEKSMYGSILKVNVCRYTEYQYM